MASNLMQSGYPLTVYDINPEAIQTLVDQGAKAADSPREVAEQSEIVITSLLTPAIVEATVNSRSWRLAKAWGMKMRHR